MSMLNLPFKALADPKRKNYENFKISLLFILMGTVMGRIKHNYFADIKTAWTLANEEV